MVVIHGCGADAGAVPLGHVRVNSGGRSASGLICEGRNPIQTLGVLGCTLTGTTNAVKNT